MKKYLSKSNTGSFTFDSNESIDEWISETLNDYSYKGYVFESHSITAFQDKNDTSEQFHAIVNVIMSKDDSE